MNTSLTSVIYGEGSAIELYCRHNNVDNHRKLVPKLKSGSDLEYIDPKTGAAAKLSDENIFEINASQSFKATMQNETGPI